MKGLLKIIFVTLVIGGGYQEVFATNIDNATDDDRSTDNSWDLTSNRPKEDKDITLDGMIGPYDPSDPDDDPDFSQIPTDELEGKLPDNYYTISVSVPTHMQFTAISDRFFSPQYTIENRATRPIYVTVTGVVDGDIQEDDKVKKLYLTKPNNNNNDIEADVLLSMTNSATSVKNKVHVSDFDASATNYLGVVGYKESGTLEFESNDFEIPGKNAPNKSAKNNFKLELTFSLEDPTQSSQPDEQTDSEDSTGSPDSENPTE